MRAVIGRTQHGVVVPCGVRKANVAKAIKSKRVITAEKKGRVWKIGANERNTNLFVIAQRVQPNLAVSNAYVKNPNKTQSAVCHTKEPLKALRYAFHLKAKFGLNIGANFVDRLMHEHNTLKNVAV